MVIHRDLRQSKEAGDVVWDEENVTIAGDNHEETIERSMVELIKLLLQMSVGNWRIISSQVYTNVKSIDSLVTGLLSGNSSVR